VRDLRKQDMSDTKVPGGVSWITVRGSDSSNDVLVTCTRCSVRLVVPAHIPVPRFEALLMGFTMDHDCPPRTK